MDIENLIDIFSAEVIKNRPDLSDFSQGSVLYTLARGVALAVNELYQEIELLRDNSLLVNDTIDESLLTSISPALARITGKVARGDVLIGNLDSVSITLPVNTVLTDPVTSTQYFTTASITINSITESRVEVQAADFGVNHNLPAGRNLINVDYPRLIFTVGEYRQIDNTIVGGLAGGVDPESNVELIKRARERLLSQRVTQRQQLIDFLLTQGVVGVNISSVSLETLRGGLLIVWVTSSSLLTYTNLTSLNNLIQPYLPVGIYSEVKQIVNVPITIRIQTFEETNLVVDKLISDLVTQYVEGLSPGASLLPASIRNLVSERTGIVGRVLEPREPITLNTNQRFQVLAVEVINAT